MRCHNPLFGEAPCRFLALPFLYFFLSARFIFSPDPRPSDLGRRFRHCSVAVTEEREGVSLLPIFVSTSPCFSALRSAVLQSVFILELIGSLDTAYVYGWIREWDFTISLRALTAALFASAFFFL